MPDIPMHSPTLGAGVLTTDHARSSYGDPVFVAGGVAYGPGDLPDQLELMDPADARRVRTLRHQYPHWRPAIRDRRSITSAANAGSLGGETVAWSLRLPRELAEAVDAAADNRSEAMREALEAWLEER